MEVVLFVRADGHCPYREWLDHLRDRQVRSRVQARVERLRRGNLGDARTLGAGLWELRFHFGPGYRIYFGKEGSSIVILLCGGDKNSQDSDLEVARDYLRMYEEDHDARPG